MTTYILDSQQPTTPKTLVYKCLLHPIDYGVMYTIEVDGKIDTIKFETKVLCRQLPANVYCYTITRLTKTFINDTEPDLLIDVLAIKVAAILYPLRLIVSAGGDIIAIENFADIKTRWVTTQQDIQKKYKGELVEKYLQLITLSLQDENTVLRSILADWFLCAFFNSIYQSDDTTFNTEKWVSFPLVAKSSAVLFKATQNIQQHYTEDNLINLNIEGEIADARCKADFEDELNYPHFALQQAMPMAIGKYNAQYYLSPYNHAVETIYLQCEINLTKKKIVTVLICNLKSTAYQIPVENKFSLAMDEGHEIKKTFWEKLTGQ